jgi:hypothetical protein
LPEDAKFESGREVMIDPAVDAGFGENRGQVTARLEERSFGATRSFTAGALEDAGIEVTRRRMDGNAERCEIRGNSEIRRSASPKD